LGNACWIDKHFTNDIQTRQYRSPEVILEAPYDTSTDIWSLGCIVFELLTGDYLFDPKKGVKYTKDEDHIAQMIELLGSFPKMGKYYNEMFNRKGTLRHIHKLRFWKLSQVLYEKYQFSNDDSLLISEFLEQLIVIDPKNRATAQQTLELDWLKGVDLEETPDIEMNFN
jgi:serine/threonine protein kinase